MDEQQEQPTKILVLLPQFETDPLEVLPFLKLLRSKFPEAELNLLCDEEDRKDLFFLDPTYRIFVLREEDKGVLGGHKFSVNLKDVFNVTHFFNLREGVAASLLGMNFKAKARVGYKTSLDRVFYTHSFTRPQGLRKDQEHVRLLEFFLEETFEEYKLPSFETKLYDEDFFKAQENKKEMTLFWRKFDPSFEEFNFWKDFLLDLKETTVHLIAMEENEHFKQLKEEIGCIEVVGKVEKIEELKANFQTSQFFISSDPFASRMASMYGLHSVLVSKNIRVPQSYYYFEKEPARVSFDSEGKGVFLSPSGEELFEDSQMLIDILFKDLSV